MEGRGLTNILLAVIAGVLLFGKDAMLGGLQGLFVVALAIGVIWLVLWGFGKLLAYIWQEWKDAKDWTQAGSVLFFIAFCFVGLPMLAYAALLWFDGVERPLNVALDSWIGTAWMGVVILLMGGFALVGLGNALRWLSAHTGEVPGIVGDRLRVIFWGYLEFLGGPITFPIREWRIREEAGSGIAAKIVSAAYVTVIGLVVALMTASLTALAGYGVLSGLGIVK